ncbi:MAG: tRNA lysidine(34) synthetase TilS [Halioglobus sp.]
MPEQSSLISSLDSGLASRLHASRWYVAFSGGLDSTVLLHLLNAWRQVHPDSPELVAWHVNHGMQATADEWVQHCSAQCADWGISFRSDRVTVESQGQGVEAAARNARYGIFEEGLEAGDILFMAHHLDDQVETFFLRLMRGAGLQGLSGMPDERSLGRGLLVRPLLGEVQESLRAYASEQHLSFIEDPSNNDMSLDRNFLRGEVLPLLATRWGGYRQTVNRASGHLVSALSTLEESSPAPQTLYSTMGDPGVSMQFLKGVSREVAAFRLRSWLGSWNLPLPPFATMDEFLRQLDEGLDDSAPRLNCGSYVLGRYGEGVYLLPEFTEGEPSPVQLVVGGDCDIAGIGTLSLVQQTTGPGLALGSGDVLEISSRNGGERCRPQGRAHSQTLKKLFQERAVPPWWRGHVPLVTLGGELLSVGDLWLCESSRLQTPESGAGELWQLHWRRNTFALMD